MTAYQPPAFPLYLTPSGRFSSAVTALARYCVFLLLSGLAAQAQDIGVDLSSFLSAFPQAALPLTIDAEFWERAGRGVEVDAELASRLVPELDSLHGTSNGIGAVARPFAVAQLPLGWRFVTLLFRIEGSAGGYSDTYALLTLGPHGTPIGWTEVGRFSGDAGHEATSVTVLHPDGQIEVETTTVHTDSETFEETGRTVEREGLRVTPDGRIRRVD